MHSETAFRIGGGLISVGLALMGVIGFVEGLALWLVLEASIWASSRRESRMEPEGSKAQSSGD